MRHIAIAKIDVFIASSLIGSYYTHYRAERVNLPVRPRAAQF
jgi:hypothetical protein